MKGKKTHEDKMSRSCRATGGRASGPESENEEGVKVGKGAKPTSYTATPNNVETEAEQPTGFKKGGKVAKKDGMKAEGDKAAARLDRAKRASGGKVASGSRSPFTESAKTSERPGFKGMSNIDD